MYCILHLFSLFSFKKHPFGGYFFILKIIVVALLKVPNDPSGGGQICGSISGQFIFEKP
jgi:hypothetical protein